jgi:hypothetical protein
MLRLARLLALPTPQPQGTTLMAAPTVSATLDAAAYAVGATMTLTVTYADPDSQAIAITVQASDSSGNTSAPMQVSALIDPVTLAVSDDGQRTWTKVSDTGSVAVFTAVA